MPERSVPELLKDKFAATKNVDALVRHFQNAVDEFQKGEWEKSLAKSAKFLEAVLKALLREAGLPAQVGRQFKVDKAINDLGGTQAGTVDDAVRLAIPRCCRFMYDITSNRGGRHDPDEINPNEMDASAMVANAAWVLAEMVRYSQRNLDLDEAKNVVDGLMKRKYPFIEEIDGRVYVDLKIATSAREVGLLVLWYRGAKRISKDELITSVERHSRRITRQNAHTAVSRLSDVVDDDGNGNLRLRASGLKEADDLIEARKGRR